MDEYNFIGVAKMLDKIAGLQHEIWSHWMKYLFEVSLQNEDGTVTIPADQVKRWKYQMSTKYLELSDDEQKSDLEQARKVMDLVNDVSVVEKRDITNRLERTE
jgi:hypothetical protein